jgi:peptidoglycan/LPS O-acetylase OafA/YrhL
VELEPRNFSLHARIPTLDGWRGIAIIVVLISHYQEGYLHHFFFNNRIFDLGQHGVTIFLVLSGFLITTGLLTNAHSDLRLFYIRRFFRIVPVSAAYLLSLYLLTHLTSMKAIGGDLWGCLFFYRNYLGETQANTCTLHFWSLSLEEQFYLVWPLLIVLLGNLRRRIIAAGICALTIAVFRWAAWDFYSHNLRFLRTEVRADALIVGCLLALVFQYGIIQSLFHKYAAVMFSFGFLILVTDINHFHSLTPLHESLAVAALIGSTVMKPGMIAGRLLEMEHLKMIGVMSYSIYIWQGIFFRDNWGVLGPILLSIVAFSSWALIERAGIAFGSKITRKWRSPSFELHRAVPVTEIA